MNTNRIWILVLPLALAATTLTVVQATPANAASVSTPTTKGSDPPGIDIEKRNTHHEMGHVVWAKMTVDERAVWTEIWTQTKGTESELWQTFTKDGETANYYCENAMEGFCVAFSYMMLDIEVAGAISGFIEPMTK